MYRSECGVSKYLETSQTILKYSTTRVNISHFQSEIIMTFIHLVRYRNACTIVEHFMSNVKGRYMSGLPITKNFIKNIKR